MIQSASDSRPGRIYSALMREKWLFCGIASFITLVALLAALLMTPVYRAEVVLVPVDITENQGQLDSLMGQFGGIAALAGIQLASQGNTGEAIGTLRSRELTSEFIVARDLLPVLFPDQWDESSNDWTVADEDEIPSMWDAYELFDNEIRNVVEDPSTGLVILVVEWRDRRQAADWANELVELVNQKMRRRAVEEAEESLKYLNGALEETNVVELQTAIYRLIESQINKIMVTNVREEYAFRVIDPAVVPDEDDFVRPRRVLMLALGIVLGALFGGIAAVIRFDMRGGS